jgi:FkbM family methyltransferase
VHSQTKIIARNFMRLFTPRLLASRIRRKWELEPEIGLLPALCDDSRVSFDVGSNWGQYLTGLRSHSAAVVACEPIPELARFLRRAFRDVRIMNVALANRKGSATFNIEQDWGRSSLSPVARREGARIVTVPLDTLDSIATRPVGFIKVDVEGHEEEVLDGALEVISRDLPVLLVEIEERHRPGALKRILDKLSPRGYCAFFLHDGVVRSIDAFDPSLHQIPGRPGTSKTPAQASTACYINNFVFIHRSVLDDRVRRLEQQGYSVAAA